MRLAITTTALLILLLASTILSSGQANKRRKRNSAKYPKAEISCSHHLDTGTLCAPPIKLGADSKDGVSQNTVTVQISIDEDGKVISARAVSGNRQLYEIALENAKSQKFPPKILSGKPVRVTGIIVYKFEDP
jgi:hypothetical protein